MPNQKGYDRGPYERSLQEAQDGVSPAAPRGNNAFFSVQRSLIGESFDHFSTLQESLVRDLPGTKARPLEVTYFSQRQHTTLREISARYEIRSAFDSTRIVRRALEGVSDQKLGSEFPLDPPSFTTISTAGRLSMACTIGRNSHTAITAIQERIRGALIDNPNDPEVAGRAIRTLPRLHAIVPICTFPPELTAREIPQLQIVTNAKMAELGGQEAFRIAELGAITFRTSAA